VKLCGEVAASGQHPKSVEGDSETMDPSIATIAGVLLGGLLSLAGVLLQASRQLHVERQKWQQARQEEWEQATRAAVIDLSMKLAAGVQLVVWLTWYAQHSPHEVTEARLAQYEREMKTLQVELVGARGAGLAQRCAARSVDAAGG
jgi:hypothetical protein